MQIVRNQLTPTPVRPSMAGAVAGNLGDLITDIYGAAQAARERREGKERERKSEERLARQDSFAVEDRSFKRQQQEFENKLKLQEMGLRRDELGGKKREKKQQALDEVAVPGYELGGQVMPQKTEAVKLREAKGQMDALNQNLSAYEQMVAQHGTSEFTGPASEQMASLSTSIKMNLKNLYELGAITGPDLAIMQSQVPDPQSLRSVFTRSGSQAAGLQQLRQTLGRGFETRMAGAGYKPAGEGKQKRYTIISVE